MVQYMISSILLLLQEEINYCCLEKYMFILLLWQYFFVTRWLEEERLRLLASVVMVRTDITLLGTGVMKNVTSSLSLSSSDPVT